MSLTQWGEIDLRRFLLILFVVAMRYRPNLKAPLSCTDYADPLI